ncbi:sulfite exporter TauE/SafE family protein [Spirochaeta cellobiosiphila]|uniref:sulfite exporter TauE/SafE family protein n=1 Tax=Spirochaeta cellobiosiphila TaxID=504483 RepID=UPI0003FE0A2A|nr:sulfite exporter TauE/SafE family protein [Spirochaeta cellobiosiphila]
MIIMTLLVLLWGIFLGMIVGSTAVGTGLIGTPSLIFLFHLEPLMAIGTMSVAGTVMMISGALKHYKNGYLQPKIAIPFMITSFPVAFFTGLHGKVVNEYLPLSIIMGVLIIGSSLFLIIRLFRKNEEDASFSIQNWQIIASPLLGVITGFLMGATSISGSIILLSFLIILRLPERFAVGTASIVAGLTLGISSIAHIMSSHVDYSIALPLIPGVVGGAYLGAHLSQKIPVKVIQILLIIILIGAGIAILLK